MKDLIGWMSRNQHWVVLLSYLFAQVVKTCIMNDKNWEKVGYAPPQDVILSCPEDGVEAKFDPSFGDGWRITCEGSPVVGFQQHKHSSSTVCQCFQSVVWDFNERYVFSAFSSARACFYCVGSAKSGLLPSTQGEAAVSFKRQLDSILAAIWKAMLYLKGRDRWWCVSPLHSHGPERCTTSRSGHNSERIDRRPSYWLQVFHSDSSKWEAYWAVGVVFLEKHYDAWPHGWD